MNRKWVDNEVYFGPDRRTRGGKRLGERRAYDDAADPPPLGAVLRRLRIRLTENASPTNRRHAMQLLSLAIAQAGMLGLGASAAALRRAAPLISSDKFQQAEALVVEAMASLGEGA